MLTVVMIDTSARSRNTMAQMIESFLSSEIEDLEYLPQMSARALSLDEMHFRAAPDVCLIGEHILVQEQDKISVIRKAYPQATLVACINKALVSVNQIQHLARLGIDDVMYSDLSAAAFFQKVMLYSGKRTLSNRSGQLVVVDSGKGGSGVTAVTAALAEAAWNSGSLTLALDLDTETQDLCRFMKVKPYVNDPLQLLLDKQRPVTEELVQEACHAMTGDELDLYVMPATKGLQELSSDIAKKKIYHEVLLHLLGRFDTIFVDLSGADACMRKFFYSRASTALVLVENDLGAAYATLSRIQYSRSVLPRSATTLLAPIVRNRHGIQLKSIQKELQICSVGNSEIWVPRTIPYSSTIAEWPGSGGTIAHFDRRVRKAITELWAQIQTCVVSESSGIEKSATPLRSDQSSLESTVLEMPRVSSAPLLLGSS